MTNKEEELVKGIEKRVLLQILSDLNIDTRKITGYKFEKGELLNIARTAIREMQTRNKWLEKQNKHISSEVETLRQLFLNIGNHHANKK